MRKQQTIFSIPSLDLLILLKLNSHCTLNLQQIDTVPNVLIQQVNTNVNLGKQAFTFLLLFTFYNCKTNTSKTL